MTKTIIPFCVNAKEENLSEEQISQLHAWCIEAGAIEEETDEVWLDFKGRYLYMGVDKNNETLAHDYGYVEEYFDDNVIKFKEVRKHLGIDNDSTPSSQEHTPSSTPADVVDKQTLVKYANILSSDITICQDGSYRVFVEIFEQDVILKSDQELHDFVKAYQELKKFVG